MHSKLTTALFNFGANELRKTGKRKKNKVQPNTKRKSANGSHQAVSKGRSAQMVTLDVPHKKAKRSHDFAEAMKLNK